MPAGAVRIYKGKVLIVGGKIALHERCCCKKKVPPGVLCDYCPDTPPLQFWLVTSGIVLCDCFQFTEGGSAKGESLSVTPSLCMTQTADPCLWQSEVDAAGVVSWRTYYGNECETPTQAPTTNYQTARLRFSAAGARLQIANWSVPIGYPPRVEQGIGIFDGTAAPELCNGEFNVADNGECYYQREDTDIKWPHWNQKYCVGGALTLTPGCSPPFEKSYHCLSRAHCQTCRADAAWRQKVGAPAVCPVGVSVDDAATATVRQATCTGCPLDCPMKRKPPCQRRRLLLRGQFHCPAGRF